MKFQNYQKSSLFHSNLWFYNEFDFSIKPSRCYYPLRSFTLLLNRSFPRIFYGFYEVFLVPLKLSLFWYNGCLSPEVYSSCIKLGGAFWHDSRLTINWIGFLLITCLFLVNLFVVIRGYSRSCGGDSGHYRSLSWSLLSITFRIGLWLFFTSLFSLKLIFRVMY